MSNFSDPEILKHLEDTLHTVGKGLCQAREKVASLDSKTYDLIDQALCLTAAAEGVISDRLDGMYHRGEVTER
jgi:hypothetical protein